MKKMLVLIFTILLVGSFSVPAFGVDGHAHAVTIGVAPAPYMVEGEYEFKITDNSSICFRGGISPLVTASIIGAGAGYRWYFRGEALDGFYTGGYVDYLNLEGSVLGLFSVSGSFGSFQAILGYKKGFGERFIFDVGITAAVGKTEDKPAVFPGVIATIGAAW